LDTIVELLKVAGAQAGLATYGAIIIIGTFTVVAVGAAVFLFVYYKVKAKILQRMQSRA
jgi:hypothetical protein